MLQHRPSAFNAQAVHHMPLSGINWTLSAAVPYLQSWEYSSHIAYDVPQLLDAHLGTDTDREGTSTVATIRQQLSAVLKLIVLSAE